MRTLKRNQQPVYYALYEGKTNSVDQYGDPTGEPVVTYSTPTLIMCNVSPSRGTADAELFGINLEYSKTLCIEDVNCPIQEDSILWIGRTPENETPHNYIVKAVARSLNHVVYAVDEVKVS